MEHRMVVTWQSERSIESGNSQEIRPIQDAAQEEYLASIKLGLGDIILDLVDDQASDVEILIEQ